MRTMKTALKALVLLLVAMPAMMLSSCSDVDDGGYVDPIKLTEKVNGQWVVSSITQTDVLTGKDLNLTEKLGFSSFGINLGVNGSFTVDGEAPKLLPTRGTWSLDNEFVKSNNDATQILLNDGSATTAVTVTKSPGSARELEFRVIHTDGGEPYVTYTYNLRDKNAPADEAEESAE